MFWVLFLAVAAIALADPPVPVWPLAFKATFSETNKIVFSYQTTGVMYYDYANKRERTDRDDGYGDRYCGNTIAQHTPCQHIVVNGTRWLNFPKLQKCCDCCDSEHGCGVVTPDWIVNSNATYLGRENSKKGVPSDKWDAKGLQSNYYYQSIADGSMAELFQSPNDDQVFDPWTVGPLDSSLFDLPSYCSGKCGGIICSVARKEKQK
eukprot:NODE_7205_length_800_cov_69.200886_g6597_i0.p1 GENE.NODE_7205_length_800_cov_69.200886_g6597_i0~~NODE_7205_length_800_cov_69.200886_g6597_i0.p1  ORF type:complete len:207 (-),score=29.45 NODE_7205_length_800_cov_69.200886_g6597_i0:122-742(-)